MIKTKRQSRETQVTVNVLVEFVGSINVRTSRKNKNYNSARMSMQCTLYSVGGEERAFFTAHPLHLPNRDVGSLRFDVRLSQDHR
jgi:hypothetical protein